MTRATILYRANWETDGTIVYGQQDGIWRVQANGGTPEHIVRIDANELVYGPRMLPGRTAVLFSLVTRGSMVGQATAWDTARVVRTCASCRTWSTPRLTQGRSVAPARTGCSRKS